MNIQTPIVVALFVIYFMMLSVSPFMTQIIQSLKTRHKVLLNSNRLMSKKYRGD